MSCVEQHQPLKPARDENECSLPVRLNVLALISDIAVERVLDITLGFASEAVPDQSQVWSLWGACEKHSR
jgi:hypothetical protein